MAKESALVIVCDWKCKIFVHEAVKSSLLANAL